MKVYFTTVVRGASFADSGEVVLLDWETKRVERARPVVPGDLGFEDPNPGGGSRGGRGIQFVAGDVVVGSYHTLRIFDPDLRHRRDVTNGLLVGIHELHHDGDGAVWVASTAIDAALKVDIGSGTVREGFWPREVPALQRELSLEPLPIDKTADNRARFSDLSHQQAADHLHLNAIASLGPDVFALFSKHGCIVNLTSGRIAVRHPCLRRAHNLLITDDGRATVNDTQGRAVRTYDLASGTMTSSIDLMALPAVRRLVRRHDLVANTKRRLGRVGIRSRDVAKPMWVRGLDRAGDRLFVGMSPATILCIDEPRGRLEGLFTYSTDVHACIHGLKVLADAQEVPPGDRMAGAARR